MKRGAHHGVTAGIRIELLTSRRSVSPPGGAGWRRLRQGGTRLRTLRCWCLGFREPHLEDFEEFGHPTPERGKGCLGGNLGSEPNREHSFGAEVNR